MQKTNLMCLVLIVVLSFSVFCQVSYCADTILTSDDLPGLGESLLITSDTRIIINEGETALVQGDLSVNGTENNILNLKIENYGELTIDGALIRCSYANFTIENRAFGVLTVQDSQFTIVHDSTLNIGNLADCALTDVSFEVLGGFAYLQNTGSLTIENGYFKDQFDGTFIYNYADASLFDCNYVANGAEGKIEIFNSGDLTISQGAFDVNYGGTLNLNSLTGNLTVNNCNLDVSGSSHGQKSNVNLLIANSTWDSCSFVNNGGTINCLNTGEVSATDCTVTSSSADSSNILSSSGPMSLENLRVSGSGSTSITNWDSMKLLDGTFNSSQQLTLMNNAELTTKDWILKTTSNGAAITVYNDGNFTFNVPFIESVDLEVLESVGSDGQEFVESSGGTITVTNKGLMTEQTGPTSSSDSSLLYVLVVAVVVIVVVVVFYLVKKMKII